MSSLSSVSGSRCYICETAGTPTMSVTSLVRTRLGWLCPNCLIGSTGRCSTGLTAWDVLPDHPMMVQRLPPLLRMMVERRLSALPDNRWRANPEGGLKGVKGDRRSPRQRF